MALIVQKYGGTSVADAERIRNVARRIARTIEQGTQIVMVVSAMGDTTAHISIKYKKPHPVAREPRLHTIDKLGKWCYK